MPDLVKYLDKKSTQAFTLGPSGQGIAQTGFYNEWRAWFDEGRGITYVKENEYNYGNPTGYHAYGSEDILFAESISATFDSGAFLWTSCHNFNTISVFRHSGSGYSTQATFSGQWPALYYNVANNRADLRYVYCFYLKSGDNKIFARSNQDGFAGEFVFHEDFMNPIKRLNQVSRFDQDPYKLRILGLYTDGNGFQLVSDCHNLFETGFFMNFSQFNTGEITNINLWECSPANNFTPDPYGIHDNFSAYPSGVINYQFNSGYNMSGGYIWL